MQYLAKNAIYNAKNANVEEGSEQALVVGDEYCGGINSDGWYDDGVTSDFCLVYQGEDKVELYAKNVSDGVTIDRGILMHHAVYFVAVTSGGGSDVIQVGDPDDISGAYTFEYEDRYFYFDSLSYGTGYAIIDGAEQEHEIGSGLDLTVHATGSFEDDFDHVEVDGEPINEANYGAKAGSTIVTLLSSYLDSLAEGKHTLKIAYQGGEVETEFTIVRSNPETLDSSLDAVAPFTICVLSSIAIAGYTLTTKRSRR